MYNNKIPGPIQDPSLFAPVKVQVLRPFCVGGSRREVGEEVTVEAYVARGLATMGKAVMI